MAEEFTPSYTFTDDRLNELKQLFPEAFEDGVFNVDTLKELLGEHSTSNKVKEHFGLNWVGKQDARKIASKPPTGTLRPCPGEGVNEDETENVFIEGENLEVLKILRKSYMGKIKMIYIDPPYNTGNDFIYNDSFADSTEDYLRKTGGKSDEGLLVSNPKSSGKYHANWLSFMYPRLRLAKDLLRQDGVIFISIDHHEFDNLKKICDEIFGEENFKSQIVWQKRYTRSNNTIEFTTVVEYLLVYSKSDLFKVNLLPRTTEADNRYTNPDNDIRGMWKGASFLNPATIKQRPNLCYPITNPFTNEVTKPTKNAWRVGEEKFKQLLSEDRLYWGRDKKSKVPSVKMFLKDARGLTPINFFPHDYAGNTDDGTKELEDIMGGKYFENPKPTKLLKRLFQHALIDNDIVLDFFSGSGTSGQSVLSYQADINKKLTFILIQLPHQISTSHTAYQQGFRYISDITKERLRRAVLNIDKNQGFKVFKQDTSTIYKWQEFDPDQDGALPDLFNNLEIAYKNPLQDGVTTQDFITEVILQEGFPLTSKQEEVVSGIFRITHEWVPYTLYVTMLYSFKDTDFNILQLQETDHFVCLDKAFEGNDALKQELDNQCKIFTI